MTIKLKKLDAQAYATADTFFHSADAKSIATDYYNYVWSSVLQYLAEGDHAVLTRIMLASRMMHRVQVTARLVKVVACHEPQAKGDKFKGTMNKAKRQRLLKDTVALRKKLEGIINADAETKAAKKASPFDADKALARFNSTVARLVEQGISPDVLATAIKEAADKAAVSSSPAGTPAEMGA